MSTYEIAPARPIEGGTISSPTHQTLLADYVADRRTMELPEYKREELPYTIRYTPLKPELGAIGILCFTHLEESRVGEAIEDQLAHFTAHGCEAFEWKVFSFDHPPNLGDFLAEHGFVADDEEGLLFYDLSDFKPRHPAEDVESTPDVRIEKIEDEIGIRKIVQLQETVWNQSFPSLESRLAAAIQTSTVLFGAFLPNNDLIGSGWIDYPEQSAFAELHGGSVLPQFRGQRIYAKLLASRFADAIARRVPYITVDAAPMSLPILKRNGFPQLASSTPMKKRLHQT